METTALSLKEAEAFLKDHKRHYKMPFEPICAIGLVEGKKLHGAAILGRNAKGEAGLAHIYVDGVWQGYSLLYGTCWRAFHAMGYKMVTL